MKEVVIENDGSQIELTLFEAIDAFVDAKVDAENNPEYVTHCGIILEKTLEALEL